MINNGSIRATVRSLNTKFTSSGASGLSEVNGDWPPLSSMENAVAMEEFVVGLSLDLETLIIEGGAEVIEGTTTVVEQLSIDGVSQLPEDIGLAPIQKWVLCCSEECCRRVGC
jgi:hypothetical protein